MRGEDIQSYRQHRSGERNIPTCVGKTEREADRLKISGEHPHVRGEDTKNVK